MHALFNLVSTVNYGIMKFPDWLYVRDGLKRNLGSVVQYYRKNPMAVKSDHFLVRLLQSIAVPQSQNLERYYDNVDALALNMSMALKLTSSIYRGQVFEGIFYGSGSTEILIAHDETFDPLHAHKHWQNIQAVKVLRHPRSDLGMNLPDGIQTGSETGLAVIAINIPLLAVQYRAFRLNEIYLNGDTESQKSVMQFVHMYVLPNMLFSHIDLALFNRISKLLTGVPLGESRKSHSFYLPSFDDKVDAVHNKVIASLDQVGQYFAGILRTVPALVKDQMEEVMLLPDIAPTRQVDWALSISRLPALSFLFQASKNGPGERNQREVNQILRSVLAYKTNNTMRTMLPLELYQDVQNEIDGIIEKAR